jgi:hypothetical protein
MKTQLLIGFSVLSAFATAQQQATPGTRHLFNGMTPTGLQVGAGYSTSPVKGYNLNGFNFNIEALLNRHFGTGFNTDGFSTHRIVLPDKIAAVNPQLTFWTFSWRNEFFINPGQVINFSVPVDVGIATVNYNDEYYAYNNSTRTISDATFFSAAAGVNMYVSLFRHVAIGAGARYRLSSGASRIGTDADYSGYLFTAGIRLQLDDEDLKK